MLFLPPKPCGSWWCKGQVNGVAPGRIDTPLHQHFTSDQRREETARQIPLKRGGTPEEVVGAEVYLTSLSASCVLGEIIEVNGGLWTD